jgi:aspartate aminotransferase
MEKGTTGVTDRTHTDLRELFAERSAGRLSAYAERIVGSSILTIAAEIRELIAAGETVANLTVGDFRPDQFPIPPKLRDHIVAALAAGETNYPPLQGVPALRKAVAQVTRDDFGLDYPPDCFLIAGGARPLLYSAYMTLVDPGDIVLYPVPSWNNHHYVTMAGARGVPLSVEASKNFHVDADDLAGHLAQARLLMLNSPLNPTGTCISRGALAGICEAIVRENERRAAVGERSLFLVYDQVYNTMTFGDAVHYTPVGVTPEVAPYTLMLDAVSKGLCGTGLRVGWACGPPAMIHKMAELAGHYGAWAPRPEQVATAAFLSDPAARAEHREWMIGALQARLGALDEGFSAMRADGLPVTHIEPQGAIYLSVRFDLHGRTVNGRKITDNEALRQVLLSGAGFAVVPFEAFGFHGEEGWMRISVGAVSEPEVRAGVDRVRRLLETAR